MHTSLYCTTFLSRDYGNVTPLTFANLTEHAQ